MTAPILGPFFQEQYLNRVSSSGYAYRTYEWRKTWYRQKTPFNLPLEFTSNTRRVARKYYSHSYYGSTPDDYTINVSNIPEDGGVDPETWNEAYGKFKDRLYAIRQESGEWEGSDASLGVSFAETRQSLSMVTNRLKQLYQFQRELRTGRFGKAAEVLGTSISGRKLRKMEKARASDRTRDRAKSFANNYLEFHFGWSPLIQDIHDACQALSNPILPHRVRVRSTRFSQHPSSSVTYSGGDRFTVGRMQSWKYQYGIGADVEVENPNLGLASQLGLVNPATVLWELVPFSFVVDWFANVGDYLSSFTDFAGLRLVNPFRTYYSEYKDSYSAYDEYNYGSGPHIPPWPFYWYRYTVMKGYEVEGFYVRRVPGPIPGPILTLGSLNLNPRRGLAAISLLIQGMPSSSRASARTVIAKKDSSFRRNLFPEAYGHL